MDNSQIAIRIKNKCKEKKISINQLTKDCGFGKNLINDMETKNTSPSVDKIIIIANYLECSVNYLLGIPEKTENINKNFKSDIQGDNNGNVGYNINKTDETANELLTIFKGLSFSDKAKVMNLVAELSEKEGG